jgi:endonuclease YncB( thermonuclease family)
MSNQFGQQARLIQRWARYRAARANQAITSRTSKPQVLDGWQVRLIDGDTFAYGAERIRIRGIDTPEKSETGGFDASQRLDLLLREGPIVVVPEAVDKYGRVVADVYVNGRNVAEVLRGEGHVKPRP